MAIKRDRMYKSSKDHYLKKEYVQAQNRSSPAKIYHVKLALWLVKQRMMICDTPCKDWVSKWELKKRD